MRTKPKQTAKKLLTIVMSVLMLFGMSVPSMQAFAEDTGDSTQTVHEVKFVVTPSSAKITVKDGSNKEIKPSENDKNIYKLNNGSYTYSASADGYESIVDKNFKVEKEQEIKVDLVKKKVSPPAMLRSNAGATKGELSLDNVKINEFKIIDVANGNKEIEYKKESDNDYEEYKNDPDKFKNAICENQKDSRIKLKLGINYKSNTPLKEGDTIIIPAQHSSIAGNFSENPLPIKDALGNILGVWKYKDGNFILEINGDYITNNVVKEFNATFETGEMIEYSSLKKKNTETGKKYVEQAKLGKDNIIIPYEYRKIDSATIGQSLNMIYKWMGYSTDSKANWDIHIYGDVYRNNQGEQQLYFEPYLLENDGKYSPNTLTNIYVEDDIKGAKGTPNLDRILVYFSGIDDNGKVISGRYTSENFLDLLNKVEQKSRTKEEVKDSLKPGEFCIYDNGDASYTFMLKLWDMNDEGGITYDNIPSIQNEGGVGNYLKKKYPDAFGNLSNDTIDKINQLHEGKAIQNIYISLGTQYIPVKEKTKVENTVKVETSQTGNKDYPASGYLTPPAGIADAPANPLSIKMLKTDKDTGADLSAGFNFELQTSTDNGANWSKVDLDASMVEIGTLNGDETITPDAKGVVQVKKLTGGNMYRFVEKTHADGYQDVKINEAQPNDKEHTTSANSKAVTVSNQGSGQVIVMYNEKKVEIKVNKKWEGPKKDSVKVQLLADKNPVVGKVLTLNENNKWEGSFTGLAKYNKDGSEIKYDVAELKIDGYESKKTGDAKIGFTFTNKNIEKTKIKVNKRWEGPEKDSVVVKLIADKKEVPGVTLTLSKAGNWEGEFTELAKYNKDGSEIKYDVAELKIDGYESKKTGDAKIGFTFTNKNTEKVSIPVEKKWVGKKADKVVIKLLVGNEVKDTVTLNQGNEWKHVFKNLPKYNKDGSKIPYDIEEVKVDGYITGKSGTAETGFTITNTITGKVSVPVTKKWEGKEGDSATINLLADGKKVDSIVLNKDNNWQHTFANLEKYKDGNEIKYTIEEVKLPFYDMSQSGNAEDGFVVTNKHVPPVKTVYKGGTTTKIDGKKVNPGDKLTYVVTYKNTTGKEVEATITDKIPAHTKFVSADNGGKYADGKVTWTKKVANGETFKVTFTVEVDKDVNGEVIKNKAKVNDGENDYDTNETTNPTPKKPKTPESKNPNRPNGPRTGDDTNLTLLMLLLLSSCGALGTAVTIRRKRR